MNRFERSANAVGDRRSRNGRGRLMSQLIAQAREAEPLPDERRDADDGRRRATLSKPSAAHLAELDKKDLEAQAAASAAGCR